MYDEGCLAGLGPLFRGRSWYQQGVSHKSPGGEGGKGGGLPHPVHHLECRYLVVYAEHTGFTVLGPWGILPLPSVV